MGTTNLKGNKKYDPSEGLIDEIYPHGGPSKVRAIRGFGVGNRVTPGRKLKAATAAAKKARSNTVGSVVSDIGKATVTSAKQVGKGLLLLGKATGHIRTIKPNPKLVSLRRRITKKKKKKK